MTFSENLFALRKEKGLSQNELAKRAGLSQTAIYYLEKGKRQAKFETILRIAAALDADFLELIDDNDSNLRLMKTNRDQHDIRTYGKVQKRNFNESVAVFKEIQDDMETQIRTLFYSFTEISACIQSLELSYQLLNDAGKAKAEDIMEHAAAQIAQLTQMQEYQK